LLRLFLRMLALKVQIYIHLSFPQSLRPSPTIFALSYS